MTTTETRELSAPAQAFVAETIEEFEHLDRTLRQVGALTPNGTFQVVERVPGERTYVALWSREPLDRRGEVEVLVGDLDGHVHSGNGARAQFLRLLREQPELTTVTHIHALALGAWAQTQRPLPIRYAPAQRRTLARAIPSYVDRTQTQEDFILERLAEEPTLRAILEANGGATAWGSEGLVGTLQEVLLLEEGAHLHILAEAIGGSRDFGPGVLAQQWRMGGRTEAAVAAGLLPA